MHAYSSESLCACLPLRMSGVCEGVLLSASCREPTVTVKVLLKTEASSSFSSSEGAKKTSKKGLKGVLISCSSLNDPSFPAAKLLTNADGSAVFTPKKFLRPASFSSGGGENKEEKKNSVILLRMKPLLKGYEFSPAYQTVEIPQEEGGNERKKDGNKEDRVLDKVVTFTAVKTLFDCTGHVYPLGLEKKEKWSLENFFPSSSRQHASSSSQSYPLLVRVRFLSLYMRA